MLKPLKQPNIKDEQWVIPEKMMETETILSELQSLRKEVEGMLPDELAFDVRTIHNILFFLDERIARLKKE